MPEFEFPEPIDVQYDSLSNQQRLAIKLLMDGKGLKNPAKQKIEDTKKVVTEEQTLIEEIDGLNEQHKSDILLLLDKLQDSLEKFGIHTDKISGSSGGDLTEFFERLSVTAMYNRVMKTITGIDDNKYSFIFASILEIGDKCLGNITKSITCDEKEGDSKCGGIIAGSGIKSLAQELKNNPSIAYDVVTCHLPTIIECLDNTIVDEEINLCEAK